MASGENQGLQISLILLFCLVVLLSLTTFTFFTQREDLTAQLSTELEKVKTAEASSRLDLENLGKVVEWIGIEDPGPTDLERVNKLGEAHDADMKKYLDALPGATGQKSYHHAIEALLKAKLETDEGRETLQKQLADQSTRIEKAEAASQAKVKASEDAQKKAEADLADQQAKFNDGLRKKDDELKDLVAKIDTAQKEKAQIEETANKEKEDLVKMLAVKDKQLDELRTKVDGFQGLESIISDDGEIRLVNQRTRTVWINLGRADYLKPQISFTVHSPDSKTAKGKLEVTRVLDDHLAEARILDDSLVNPLVPGDKIYTPLWDPGKPEHFVIAGRIRVNDPDIDGLVQLRSLIAISGGVIDGELLDDGTQTGTLTAQARYLVVGDYTPKCKPKYDQWIADAKALGVEAINVEKFLDKVGYKPPSKSIVFGPGGNADQFPKDDPNSIRPKTTGTMSGLFEKRRPPSSTKPASAY